MSYPDARRVVLSRTPVSGKSYASAARKSTSDKCIQCTVGTYNSSDSETPTNPEDTERFAEKTKKQKGSSTGSKAHFDKDPENISRDFHRKIEQDTLTRDCSEDDEALMDIQSGPSTFSSGGGASAAL
ncbi:hypothetical protein TNCV_2193661 [Trichonephila clavipes]|uniref:Uncharacterized protein n=1 Tax=Trichonephila clavipes TaxID=2585209 RepID=A0A8X6SG25_TRICX|nr:hypothetical protein TNCV_2193661 [Trichonephila clavipes]